MAHFTYPVQFISGVIVNGDVPDGDTMTLLAQQSYAAINGDGGGTWAPGSFITIGGSGVQFTGTAHSLAAAARLNVESTGEVRIKNGAMLRVDGTSGDIRLEVVSNVAKVIVESGGVVEVYGETQIKDGGALTVEDNGAASFEDGSELVLLSGALETVSSGASVSVYGQIQVQSAGNITLLSGGGLTAASGSTVLVQDALNVSGDLTLVGSAKWVNLSPDRTWHRCGTNLIVLTYAGVFNSGPTNPDVWTQGSNLSNGPCWRTVNTTDPGGFSIIEFTNLPVGGSLSSVTITTRGTKIGSIASTLPKYQIVSWDDTAAAGLTTHSSLTNDDGSIATFGSTETQTTVTASATTIDPSRRYGLKITHPYEAINEQGMYIYECTAHGTLDVLKA